VHTDLDRLRQRSRWLAALTLTLFALTAAVLLLPIGYVLVRQLARHDPITPLMFGALLLWLPACCYLYALWAIRAGFKEFGRGGVFGPVIASSCTHAGWALAIGGTLSAVGVPNLTRLLVEYRVFAPTARQFAGILQFDVAYLAVGVVGLALILMGGLLTRAAELQAEAAELRDELGGFV
jgi:hypothetical protein